MGNIVSDPNDNQLIANTRIRDLITDWAKNDYDAGLSWRRTNIDGSTAIKLKNILQKRACCTRQAVMTIALPIIDLNSIGSNLIKPGYTPIKIRVFEDSEFNTNPNTCKFYVQNSPNEQNKVSYLQNFTAQNLNDVAVCSALYQSGSVNLGLCKKIKDENKQLYADPSQQSYGYYATDRNVISDNSLDSYNNYTDCNCENSILRDITLPAINGLTNLNHKEVFVQSADNYCTTCSTNGRCYVYAKLVTNSVCINIADIKDTIAENSSSITNIQKCSVNNEFLDPGADERTTDNSNLDLTGYIKPTTKAAGNAPIIIQPSNNNTAIIAISVLIGILIISLFVIIYKLYKKSTIDNVSDNLSEELIPSSSN